MLEKLFPAIFNSEQLNHDRSMNWPGTICRDCKCKVIDAYALYEQCEKSVDLLNQQQMTSMICNGASIVSNGQYFNDKRSEDTPLPTEEIFALQLVKLDDSMQLPSTASLDDKCNEINTHVLQDQCEMSDDLLNHQQSKPISNDVPILIKGKSVANYPSEEEQLLTDLQPLEVSSSVLLVDLDEDPILPSERPFGCEICGMRYGIHSLWRLLSNDMVKHMKIHVGNNPYQCDRCDESFRLLSDLRNHYKAHYQTGEPDPGSSPEQGDGIRFTSIDILQIRYKKEKGTLEKLFPAVFNDEQLQHDYSMNWPKAVCRDCKQKVQDAYELYETCLDSSDKLLKKGFAKDEKFDQEITIHPEDCIADVSTEEFIECDLIQQSVEEPQEPQQSLIVSLQSVKTRKTEAKETARAKKVSTVVEPVNIKEEIEELVTEELIDANDAEFLEAKSDEPDWEPPPAHKSRKAASTRAKTEKTSRGRMKKEKKVKTKREDKVQEEILESTIEVYPCQICTGLTFSSPKELTDHMKEKHSNQIRSCDKCPKVFVCEQTFQHHQYCHATGRSFFCAFCNKGFQTEMLLKSHVQSHARQPKFLCSICGKGFINKSGLQKHITFHTDSKSYPCSLCPCRFNTKACLNVHMRTHTKNKIYTCSTCGSQFNKHYSMVKHQIIHTGERPFACDVCPMRFISPYHVKRHMLTHTGEKPYKCTYCDRSFAQSNVLVKHMRTHIVTMEEEFLTIALKPTLCRICAVVCTEQYCIYEAVYKEETLSMHMMMEKLVPSVFNAEQVKVDEFMCWPRKICAECKHKILEAYALYEQCIRSGDLLRECLSRKTESFIIEDVYEEVEQTLIDSSELVSNYADDETYEPTPIVQRPMRKKAARKSNVRDISTNKLTSDIKVERVSTPSEQYEHQSDDNDTSFISASTSNTKASHSTSTRQRNASSKRSSAAGNEKTQRGKPRTSRKIQKDNEDPILDETKEPETKVDTYRCLLCNAPTYSSPKELTEHLKTEHPDQIHCCKQCPKVFMTKVAFEHHQYCHATGRSFFCMFCDKGFQTEQLLKNHIRTHTHGTGFLCSHCGQEFSNRSNLRQHLIRHTGDKPWQCTLCPSRFSMKSDRYFTCEVCNMRFTSSHHVKRHMLTHTGEKPFKCTYCERSFTQSNDMVKHMKTHVGNNPYQCDRCDAAFRLLTDLRNHYKEHYQAGNKDALSGEEDKNIRFTSTNILKIRYEKEMNQSIEKFSTEILK
uniref:Protein krueppel n=1 Tax=Anopheles culicifacies TaxID=139723 RepID=A0A182M8R9_9DIPT